MYAEITAKNNETGLIVVTDTLERVMEEAMKWIKSESLGAADAINGFVLNPETGEEQGSLSFTENQLVYAPTI